MKTFFLLLLLALVASGQCRLTLKDSPAIRNIKLGMSEDEVRTVMGPHGSRTELRYYVDRNYLPRLEQIPGLQDIESFQISFFRNKAYEISVRYADAIFWRSDQEFINVFAPKLGLPTAGWSESGLACSGFHVSATDNRIRLTDDNAAKAMDELDAQRKASFKP